MVEPLAKVGDLTALLEKLPAERCAVARVPAPTWDIRLSRF